MNPLFEKYFHGELSETEETDLEAQLERSEESAWEFSRIAEETYRRYGLPDPGDGPDAAPPGRSKSKLWLLSILILLLLGGARWWMGRPEPEATQAPAAPVTEDVPVKSSPPKPKSKAQAVARKAIPPPPVGVPPSAAAQTAVGENLRVVVNRETGGPVRVRVVNAMGVEVRRLYEGMLQKGRWSFEWDGRGTDGRLVEPGDYRIDVQTEAGIQSRPVVIH